MNNKQLKVIAEGMGFMINHVKNNVFEVGHRPVDLWEYFEYNPLTNNDQMVELMSYLLKNLGWFQLEENESGICLLNLGDMGSGTTINEVVCKAAYQYFMDKV